MTKKKTSEDSEAFCATGWNRTNDIRIFSPALYQLSYCGGSYYIILKCLGCVNIVMANSGHFFFLLF